MWGGAGRRGTEWPTLQMRKLVMGGHGRRKMNKPRQKSGQRGGAALEMAFGRFSSGKYAGSQAAMAPRALAGALGPGKTAPPVPVEVWPCPRAPPAVPTLGVEGGRGK